MQKKVTLTLKEIKSTSIDFVTSIKIFIIAIVLIPWSFLVHLFFTIFALLKIPGDVIDIITLGEKTKIAIKRRHNANL